jgi:membrane protein YqaA with SNARE-associated domain
MVTKKSLTLTALVASLILCVPASCASQTRNIRTYLFGYDIASFRQEQLKQDFKFYKNPNQILYRHQPPMLKFSYEF